MGFPKHEVISFFFKVIAKIIFSTDMFTERQAKTRCPQIPFYGHKNAINVFKKTKSPDVSTAIT